MTNANVAVILQARSGSTRLPGKAMLDIDGQTILARCLLRLRAAGVGRLLLATTTLAADDALVAEAERVGVPSFRGSADDVLGRYVEAAASIDADLVVRATGDNPAVDPGSILRLARVMRLDDVDHAVEADLPVGGTVEIVKASALRKSARRAREAADREHVTTFIRRPASGYRCAIVPAPAPLSRPDLRFTIDTPADLAWMRAVIRAAGRGRPGQPGLRALIAAADRLKHQEHAA